MYSGVLCRGHVREVTYRGARRYYEFSRQTKTRSVHFVIVTTLKLRQDLFFVLELSGGKAVDAYDESWSARSAVGEHTVLDAVFAALCARRSLRAHAYLRGDL